MRLCVSAPDIREMPRLDRDEARDMTHPGHLQKLYYEWLKTCHGYRLDVISEKVDDVPPVLKILRKHGLKDEEVEWSSALAGDFDYVHVETTLSVRGLTGDEASKIAIEIKGLMEKSK